MKTFIAITSELDDLEFASQELTAQINEKMQSAGIGPLKNTIGIVYCDADVDVEALGGLLHSKLGFDVAGLTTTATIERYNGYNDMGILLCVLTADDVDFSVGSAVGLSIDNYAQAIGDAYATARAHSNEAPQLILTLAPYIADLTSEHYMEILDSISGGAPIFGGIATDHYDLLYQKTFINGDAYADGLVFILISGNIKPVFAIEHHFSTKAEKKGIITQSSENLVQMVGDLTFRDYVESIVPVPDDELIVYNFQSTPFIMELPDYEKNEQPVVRALCTIDHDTGAGGFLSKMPTGSAIYMSIIQRCNLEESCEGAMTKIIAEMAKNDGYNYSLVLISTCNARHLLMGDTKSLESNILGKRLEDAPPELNAIGFYGFGEICPTGARPDGTMKNRFHNISFALCAI